MIEEAKIKEIQIAISRTKKAECTKNNMRYLIRKFGFNKEVTAFDEENIQRYIDILEKERKLKQSTIITYAKRLCSIHYLFYRRVAKVEAYRAIEEPIGANLIPLDILDNFINKYGTKFGTKFYATLLFLRGSGCRVSEIENIRGSDFIKKNDKIYCKILEKKNKVKRLVFIVNREIAEELYTYATHQFDLSAKLFTKPNTIKTTLTRLNRLMPKGMRISSHSFRKALIFELFSNGYTVQQIMNITGHKSLEALAKYTKLDSESIINSEMLRYL